MQIYRGTGSRTGLLRGGLLLLSFGMTGLAAAAEPGTAPVATSGTLQEVPGIGRPVDAGALGELRGGDNSVANDIWVDGEVIGNSAEHVASGINTIDGGAFGNAAGVSTVIQNSGSNVLIQNAMIINVQFGPPGL